MLFSGKKHWLGNLDRQGTGSNDTGDQINSEALPETSAGIGANDLVPNTVQCGSCERGM